MRWQNLCLSPTRLAKYESVHVFCASTHAATSALVGSSSQRYGSLIWRVHGKDRIRPSMSHTVPAVYCRVQQMLACVP
jgi:hypothetical protein